VSEPSHRVVLRLSLEGSVLALVLAMLLWGIIIFGSKSVATERYSLAAGIAPASLVVCSAPQASEKGAATGDESTGADYYNRCSAKKWPHTTTSRHPGVVAAERAHRGDS
jgi:hypothetical protein